MWVKWAVTFFCSCFDYTCGHRDLPITFHSASPGAKTQATGLWTELVIKHWRDLCVCVFLSVLLLLFISSMSHLPLSQQDFKKKRKFLFFKRGLRHLIRFLRWTNEREMIHSSSGTISWGCDYVVLLVQLWVCLRSLLMEQPVGRWGGGGGRFAPAVRSGPRRARAETIEKVEGSYSPLAALHKSEWLTWRTHDAGISHTFALGYTNTGVLMHKHICSLSVCVRVCAHWCKTKLPVSYSQAVETDLTQCVHCLMRGGG